MTNDDLTLDDYRDRHPSTVHMMSTFGYAHLPERMQALSKPCHDLAHKMAQELADGPELTAGLRKLREAKDCFVMSCVLDEFGPQVDYRDR